MTASAAFGIYTLSSVPTRPAWANLANPEAVQNGYDTWGVARRIDALSR